MTVYMQPAYRHYNVPALTVIGSIPQAAVYNAQRGKNGQLFGFGVGSSYGDMIIYSSLLSYAQGYSGFMFIRVKRDGTWCVYLSSDQGQLPDQATGFGLRQIGPNTYTVNAGPGDGAPYIVTLPDLFTPSGFFRLPAVFNPTPAPPCGVGTMVNAFYLPQQGKVAYSYVQNFSTNSNWWAKILQGDLMAATVENAGYLGNYPNPQNPFVRTDMTGYPLPFTTLQMGSRDNPAFMKGATWFMGPSSDATSFWGAFTPQLIEQGNSLVCGGPGNSNVYVQTNTAWQASSASMPIQAYYVPPYPHLGYSEIDGVYLVSNCNNYDGSRGFYNWFDIITPTTFNVFELPLGTDVGPTVSYLFKDGLLLSVAQGNPSVFNSPMLIRTLQLDPRLLYPQANLSLAIHPGMVNWTRPVSTTGGFIT